MSGFEWNEKRGAIALMLAKGHTQIEVAAEHGITDRTLRRWLDNPEFAAEVDRLSLMVDMANRAERVRLAQRIIRQRGELSKADLLDWLRFVQSETNGAKFDDTFITQLAAFLQPPSLVAAEGAGTGSAEVDADASEADVNRHNSG